MQFKTKLPLDLSPHDDESGVGVCLRVAVANGFNLHWLRRETGFRESNVIDGRGATMLASVLQIDSNWLLHRLVTAHRDKSGNSWGFGGHLLYARCHVRRARPQVCPECVHQFGYCRAEWDFSLVTACSLHETPLVDWCRHCRSTLRWDRPGIAQCFCRMPISSCNERIYPLEDRVSFLVSARVRGEPILDLVRELKLPEFLTDLSLDGVLSLLHAMGAMRNSLSTSNSRIENLERETRYWRECSCRAIERLQAVCAGISFKEVSVNVPILRRMLRRSESMADRSLALKILQSMPKEAKDFLPQSELFQQRDLFGWSN